MKGAPSALGMGPKGGIVELQTRHNCIAGLVSRTRYRGARGSGQAQSYNGGGFHLKKIHGALIGSALALPLVVQASFAESPMASDHKIACTEVKYSTEFLQKFPNAPAACLEAVEKGGKRYAKFKAEVYLNSADRTTVKLLNVRGDHLSTFSFKPGPDAKVMMDGKEVKFTDLKPGEKISFYVSEERLTASEQPEATQEAWSVIPPQ